MKELEEAKPKQDGCDKKVLHVVHFLIDIHGKEHKITSLQMHKSLDNLYVNYHLLPHIHVHDNEQQSAQQPSL